MIILLNCSFRGVNSNSNSFLERLESLFEEECERIHLNQMKNIEELTGKLKKAKALVLGMPLYVDSAPAQVVELMEGLYESYQGAFPGLSVYVVSNLGFYESRQIHIQFQIVKNWCVKMGVTYGGGLAIGGGEMMGGLKSVPLDQSPNKQMGVGMRKLAKAITEGTVTEDIYVEPSGFPRRLYMLAADMSWGRNVGKNGLTKKDLYRRPD